MKTSVVALAFAISASPAFAQSSATPSPKSQGTLGSAPGQSTLAPSGGLSANPAGAGNPSVGGDLGSTTTPATQLPGAGPSGAPSQNAVPVPAR